MFDRLYKTIATEKLWFLMSRDERINAYAASLAQHRDRQIAHLHKDVARSVEVGERVFARHKKTIANIGGKTLKVELMPTNLADKVDIAYRANDVKRYLGSVAVLPQLIRGLIVKASQITDAGEDFAGDIAPSAVDRIPGYEMPHDEYGLVAEGRTWVQVKESSHITLRSLGYDAAFVAFAAKGLTEYPRVAAELVKVAKELEVFIVAAYHRDLEKVKADVSRKPPAVAGSLTYVDVILAFFDDALRVAVCNCAYENGVGYGEFAGDVLGWMAPAHR